MRSWRILVVGALVALMASLSSAQAQTPAPPAEAEAYAAQVQLGGGQVAAVGHTNATAGSTPDQAHAGALELGPEPSPTAEMGVVGDQAGPGEANGGLIETGGTEFDQLGRLAVFPWSVSVSEDATGRHSRAHAGLLELLLAPGGNRILELRVLTSDSSADYLTAASSSRAAADGVVVILGDPSTDQSLTVSILHSEASSTGTASTYLIRLSNGPNEIVTLGASGDGALGDGLAQLCGAINIPGLLRLVCVQASGGLAEFAQATLGDGAAQGGVVDLFLARGTGGGAGPAIEGTPEVLGEAETAPAPPAAVEGAALPRTGMGLAGFAAALIVLSSALLVRARRGDLVLAVARHG